MRSMRSLRRALTRAKMPILVRSCKPDYIPPRPRPDRRERVRRLRPAAQSVFFSPSGSPALRRPSRMRWICGVEGRVVRQSGRYVRIGLHGEARIHFLRRPAMPSWPPCHGRAKRWRRRDRHRGNHSGVARDRFLAPFDGLLPLRQMLYVRGKCHIATCCDPGPAGSAGAQFRSSAIVSAARPANKLQYSTRRICLSVVAIVFDRGVDFSKLIAELPLRT